MHALPTMIFGTMKCNDGLTKKIDLLINAHLQNSSKYFFKKLHLFSDHNI